MAITYAPKVGEVLECHFGEHAADINFDGNIPPEMRKNRMVVVLNGKLNDCCIVVPISSKQDLNAIQRGLHIHLDTSLFKVTDFYDKRDRWAKAETVCHVSKKRLFKLKDRHKPFDMHLPREKVAAIQEAVIKAISAGSLLPPKQILMPVEPVEALPISEAAS